MGNAISVYSKLAVAIIFTANVGGYSQGKYTARDTVEVRKLTRKAIALANSNSDSDSVKFYASKALAIAEIIDDQKGLADAHGSMGDFYWFIGDLAKALEGFEISKSIGEKIKNKKIIYDASSGIAIIHRNLGNFAKAAEIQIELIKTAEKGNDFYSAANSYSNLGVSYKSNRMFPEALEAYQHALALYEKIGDIESIPGTYINAGIVLMQQRKYDSALVSLRKGLRQFDSLKIGRGQIVGSNSLGDLFFSMGNLDSAFKYRNRAYNMSNQLSMPLYNAEALTGMGEISKSKGDYHKALKYFTEALQIAQKGRLNSSLPTVYLGIAKTYEASKQFEKATWYFSKYTSLKDSLFNAESIRQISNLRTSHDLERKEASITLLQKDNKIQQLTRNIVIIIAVGTLLLFFLRFRRQILINRKERVVIRAEYEKRLLEVQSKALRSQLNPHFIFNSLNSVNSYILKSNILQASEFLTKFSKLMRMILENSDKATVSLEEDMKLLKLYLEIEQTRTKGMFQFSIEASDQLDLRKIEIPSLLAQPFVENSIWHAFKMDKPGNMIRVNYTSDNGSLICSVSDNGVGRRKSSQGKTADPERRSFGLHIGNERLKVLSSDSNKSYIAIEDQVDEKNEGIGTTVTIRIPLKFHINFN
ncbi:hypothetical protein WSM22_47800 [Cytophagales bacterium WSM2-2]|nr:hypothetical protein WSM22_47800 [Cytophagales bacterium WSM2-2]